MEIKSSKPSDLRHNAQVCTCKHVHNITLNPSLIVVMGVSGSGKSTLAKDIAKNLSLTFIEADDFHSKEAIKNMSQGVPLTDSMRQPWVERIRDTLQLHYDRDESCVLAFSGLRRVHRERLFAMPFAIKVIFLDGDMALIARRLQKRRNHFMDPCLIQSQFDCLELPEEYSDILKLDVSEPRNRLLEKSILYIKCSV